MDYEKKYKEALEWMKSLYNGLHGATKEEAEKYFPELKESEDEKIKETLIDYFKIYKKQEECGIKTFFGIPTDNIIAWLEKQGEQKVPINDFKAKDWYVSKVDGKIHDLTYNPTDKVEPKFHEGDWIIDKQGIVHQIEKVIENVTNNTFAYDLVGGGYFNEEVKSCRLWTIQDAKDGDVLACGDKVTDCPFIFHNLTEKQNPRSYCGINTLGKFQVNDENGGFWCKSDEVRPATKEQRDLLFQKMKEEGYQWDNEKKELNKIEDEIEIPFGAKDSELQEVTYYIPKGFYAEIDDDKVVIKKGKKLAEWNEDDERIVTALMEGFRYHQLFNPKFGEVPNAEIISWLKSLKERLS